MQSLKTNHGQGLHKEMKSEKTDQRAVVLYWMAQV